MMNEEKTFLSVAPMSTHSDTGTLCDPNSASNIVVHTINSITGDLNSDSSNGMTALTSCPVIISSTESLEGKTDVAGVMKIDSIADLGSNGSTDMTVLLNQGIRTHVASDVNLGSLGDLSDTLAVSEPALDTQLKDDGGLSSTQSNLLPENLVLLGTSKGLVLSVANLEGTFFTSRFVTSSADSRGQTVITSSLPNNIFPQIQLVGSGDESSTGVYESIPDGTLLIPANMLPDGEVTSENSQNPEQFVEPEQEEKPKKKGTGGWPKGKKRKFPPKVNTPKKPMTGYVIFAIKRRKELKVTNPELSFQDATKLMGQEWSDLSPEEKEKYLQEAEADKQRYITEMKEFQSSDQYLNYVKNKQLSGGTLNGLADNKPLIDLDDGIGEELYCKLCNQYFISAHNKKEHMFGRQHLQNITNEIRKDIEEQAEFQKQQMLAASQVIDPYTDPGSTLISMDTTHSNQEDSESLDVNQFIQQFMQKNSYREQEIRSLRKTHLSFVEERDAMSKQIKELEEYQNKLDQDLGSLKAYGASLSAQVDALKMVPTLFGVINF